MKLKNSLLALALACVGLPGLADEATIRKALTERVPQLSKIDEITKSAMPGLYEVRVGTDILYSDAEGNFFNIDSYPGEE